MEIKTQIPRNLMILLFLLVGSSQLVSEPNDPTEYRPGYVLIKGNYAYFGEYKIVGADLYLRNESIGKSFKKEQIQGLVSKNFFDHIKTSSAKDSLRKSLLYFHSSAEYQWNGKDTALSNEDLYTRIIKVSLLLLTGYLFLEANKANDEVKSSYLGFNEGTNTKFQRRYQEYQLAASSTLAYFTYSSTKAYLRFGRDENFYNLNIPDREIRNLNDQSSDHFFKDKNNRIDFAAEIKL